MTTTTACVRGCGLRNQHLTDCDGTTPSGKPCRGCLPRRADHGALCWPCHHRLRDMLTQAAAVDKWLGDNIGNLTTTKVRQDWERAHGSDDGAPTPLRLQVYDARQELRDHWAEWVEWLCERETLHGPDEHTVERDSTYLLTWIDRVETWDTIGDLWDHTAWLTSCAHALAPWRPERRRLGALPCPECGEANMVIFGGDAHATCQSCRAVILAEHLGLWEQIVQDERSAS